MTYPTTEEILAAHRAINQDGRVAPPTIELCQLVMLDPILSDVVNRLVGAVGGGPVGRAVITSAIASGLNFGMRIHEQRMKARDEQDT